MAAPKQTIWELEPHTAAKHAILRRYLSAWLPILSHGGFQKLAYIDAFSGPGSYVGGEDGSPVIALKAMLEHAPFCWNRDSQIGGDLIHHPCWMEASMDDGSLFG